MNRKELVMVESILLKIKNPDSYVQEALHTIRRDLARLNKRAKEQRENNRQGYEFPW